MEIENAAAPSKLISCFILKVFSVPEDFYEDFESSWSCRNASSRLDGKVYRWGLPGLCLSSSGSTPPRAALAHNSGLTPIDFTPSACRSGSFLLVLAGISDLRASTLHLHPWILFSRQGWWLKPSMRSMLCHDPTTVKLPLKLAPSSFVFCQLCKFKASKIVHVQSEAEWDHARHGPDLSSVSAQDFLVSCRSLTDALTHR